MHLWKTLQGRSMSYQSRVREIQSAFTLGFQDRETCINLFESLLHEYGLLPHEEQLDRSLTNEGFLALLKAARDQRGVRDDPPEDADPNLRKLDDLRRAEESLKKLTRWMEQMANPAPRFRIADSVRRCPVCQKPTSALFNRVQSIDQQMLPVDPPRCQECMTRWVEEQQSGNALAIRAKPGTTVDGSPASPMSPSETDFFAEYERQMGKP